MILRVTQYGEPVLREPGEPVTDFDADLRRLADDMVETMRAEDGIGLAAQQIGEPLQLCVVELLPAPGEQTPFDCEYDGKRPPLELIMPLVMANPRVETADPAETAAEEGCLSFPGIRGDVRRPGAVRATFHDVEGHEHALRCDGLLARCVQHEVDHLHGVLFIDRMAKRDLKANDANLKKLKRASRDSLKQHKEAARSGQASR